MSVDTKKEKNIIEELYLALQILTLLYLLNKAFPLMGSDTLSNYKWFTGLYAIYVVYRITTHFFVRFKGELLISAIIDVGFVFFYIVLTGKNASGIDHLIFSYVILQSLRFPSKVSYLYVFVALVLDAYLHFDGALNRVFWRAFASDAIFIVFITTCIGMALKQIFVLQCEKDYFYTALKQKNLELDKLASTDYLTGLYNHKSFYLRLNKLKASGVNDNLPISMALIDIDNFKKINDTHGHLSGDEVLKQLAQLLNVSTRKTDFVARYGGEEFVILFPDTPIDIGATLCNRLCKKVAQTPFVVGGVTIPVTVSIGLGCVHSGHFPDVHGFIQSVDLLLYEAKHAGKNCVCMDQQAV